MILELLGWASLAHLFVDLISTLDEADKIPNKPFKCDMCTGFWISVLPLIYSYDLSGVLYAALVGILADLIFRIKQRL